MKHNKTALTIGSALAIVMLPVKVVFASSVTLPPLSVLTAEWWQWAVSIPTPVNPLADTTGQNCMVGQRDNVWFLAGTSPGASVSAARACSVPGNAALFLPIINFINVNSPNVCGQDQNPISVKDLRAGSKTFIDGARDISAKLDNRQIKSQLQRVQSQVFEITLPQDNLFNALCGAQGQSLLVYTRLLLMTDTTLNFNLWPWVVTSFNFMQKQMGQPKM